MRRFVSILVASCFLLGLALSGRAGDDKEAAAIIDKAVKAHLGKEKKSSGAYRGKNKGTLFILGQELEFTQEIALQLPGKFKETMDLTIMDKKITVKTVFDGKQGWIRAGDKDVPVTKEILEEFKSAADMIAIAQGVFVKDKSIKLSLLGEVQVNGKPALGVKVSKKGKEINFYFDKKTGLTAKVERRTRDFMSGQEVTEERIITEYQKVSGRPAPKKVVVQRDGKKFLEAEVVETQFPEKVEDSEFAKPN